MRKVLITFAMLAAASSIAQAHSPNIGGSCDSIGSEDADVTLTNPLDDSVIGYVLLDGPSVWQETNDTAGLQTHDHTCRIVATGEIITIPADDQLV